MMVAPSFHRGAEAFDSSVDGCVDVRSCPSDAERPGVLEVNRDDAPEPLASGIAVNWFEQDSNALDTPRVPRDNREHPVFRVRARLRADRRLITEHHDALHVWPERQGVRQPPAPRNERYSRRAAFEMQ